MKGKRFNSFRMSMGSIVSHGPESEMHGKGRHWRAIEEIFKQRPGTATKGLEIKFNLEEDGRLASLGEVKAGVQSCIYYPSRHLAVVYIGLPMVSILSDDKRFRHQFSAYLRQGIRVLTAFLESKGIEHEPSDMASYLDTVIQQYLRLPLPLPPSPFEQQVEAVYKMSEDVDRGILPATLPQYSILTFYIYFQAERDAAAFCHAIRNDKWNVELMYREDEWLCTVTMGFQSGDDLEKAVEEMSELAAAGQGDLDGWDVG